MKNGVPFDVAFSADDAYRMAFCVAFGELDGNTWSWAEMRWLKRDP